MRLAVQARAMGKHPSREISDHRVKAFATTRGAGYETLKIAVSNSFTYEALHKAEFV
jgi:hypothetical protein